MEQYKFNPPSVMATRIDGIARRPIVPTEPGTYYAPEYLNNMVRRVSLKLNHEKDGVRSNG